MKFLIAAAICAAGLAGGASAATLYSSDFEGTGGGWTSGGFGNWELGAPVATQTGCDVTGSVRQGPDGAHSGTGAWGTGLGACYANSDATSTLSQTFDFTGVTGAAMSWYQAHEVFYSFDTAELRVNGDLVYEITTADAFLDWTEESVDLAAYDGLGSVETRSSSSPPPWSIAPAGLSTTSP